MPYLLCVFILFLAGCASEQPDLCDGICTPTHPKFIKRAYNRSYTIKGITYTPQQHYEYKETAIASYYGGRDIFHGRSTSNGEIFNKNALTAAHKTIPIPSVVVVTNLENHRSLRLKVNDRGPFVSGRIIDISEKAAKILGMHRKGTSLVRVETDVPASLALAQEMASKTKSKQPVKKPIRSLQAKKIFIDAGGFYNHDKAWAFARHLENKGFSVQVKKAVETSISFYRVLLGPFASVQEAQNRLKKSKGSALKGAKIIGG